MKYLIILPIILLGFFSFSQEDVLFNKNYPLEWQYDCNTMIYNGDKYYFSGNIARATGGCADWLFGYHVTQINNEGIKDTTVIFDKCNETTYIGFKGSTLIHNDTVFNFGMSYDEFSNHRMFVVKTSPDYDTISINYYFEDTLTKRSFSMCFDRDYNMVLCGQVDSTRNEISGTPEITFSKSYLLKTSAQGETIWSKSYYFGSIADGCWSALTRVIPTYDNGFIAYGITNDFANSRNFILKTDSIGNQQWVKFYGNFSYDSPAFSDIIATHDSCYIVCGAYTYGETGGGYYPYDAWILKIDNDGNTKWDRKHRDSIVYDVIANHYYGFYRGVVEKDNGDLLTVCITYSDEDSVFIGQGFRIRCLDSLGNRKWDKVITRVGNQGGPLWPQSIQLTEDNGIVVGGWAEIYYFNELEQWVSDQRIFLIKTDSLGNDTLLSNITPYESKPITKFDLVCYPNPANSEFFVDLPQDFEDDVLEIYSTNGTLVHGQAVGVFNNRVDVCSLKPGMYFVKLRGKGVYGKIVIE